MLFDGGNRESQQNKLIRFASGMEICAIKIGKCVSSESFKGFTVVDLSIHEVRQ